MAKSERLKGNRSPAPSKITIGDGSIRDLAYWLMGGDVSTKQGKKKVSSKQVRAEVTSLARAQMQGNSPYVPDYAAREAEFDRVVQRNRSAPRPEPVTALPPNQNSPYTGVRGYSNTDGQRDMGMNRPSTAYASPVKQNVPLMQPNYDRRKMLFNQAKDTQYQNPIGPNKADRISPGAYDDGGGDPEFGYDIEGDIMMTPPGGGMAYGGMVTTPKKKKKKKKMMYGGKMKKYAKGGGVRKPKYS